MKIVSTLLILNKLLNLLSNEIGCTLDSFAHYFFLNGNIQKKKKCDYALRPFKDIHLSTIQTLFGGLMISNICS
jgi:hypothetical protein